MRIRCIGDQKFGKKDANLERNTRFLIKTEITATKTYNCRILRCRFSKTEAQMEDASNNKENFTNEVASIP